MSRALFALKQANNILSKQALLTIYTATIHSHLICGIQIWSSASQSTLNDLYKKQKQAIRTVCNAKFNAHSEPLFKQCNILPLPQLIDYFNLHFMHQIKFDYAPDSFTNVWQSNGDVRRGHNTGQDLRDLRNDLDFFIPPSRTCQADRLPLIALPKTWNNFENEEIKSSSSRTEFSKQLKNYLLNKITIVPNC